MREFTKNGQIFHEGDLILSTIKCSGAEAGQKYTLTALGYLSGTGCSCGGGWELMECVVNKSKNMASLKEKMALVFKGEPEKSFIKAGVMNTDETLTPDGNAVFMAWLLKKNGADFKKEVVDPILADEETK